MFFYEHHINSLIFKKKHIELKIPNNTYKQLINMKSPAKILIVEDEMIIGANISLQLSKLGHEVTGIVSRGEEAISHVRHSPPDIVLMDIQLKGTIDGIETVNRMHREIKMPIIYLTASTDEENFERAKTTNPYAFISKPFKKLDLQHAIDLTLAKLRKNGSGSKKEEVENYISPFIQSDSIYVRRNEKMIKILIKDIY